jgi:hypothetical protein
MTDIIPKSEPIQSGATQQPVAREQPLAKHRTLLPALAASAQRARRSLPTALVFGLANALAVTVITAAALLRREVALSDRVEQLFGTFAAGAWLGGTLAYVVATILAVRAERTARLAAMLVALPIGTAGGIGILYFAQYIPYFAQYHSPAFTPYWFIQMAASLVMSAFILIASGLPLLLPWGLIPLFCGALFFASRPRG